MNLGPQIATEVIDLTYPITSATDAAPDPLPRRLPLVWPGGVIGLFPWAGGDGMRGGELTVGLRCL
ncbi:MAG: hypothetical protein GY832_08340 [Chloroflexi bacterium]|nr:hypothetical protein [Chloroflexota bacterium]